MRFKTVGCFCWRAPLLMFDGALNAMRRRFPPLGLHKRILNSPRKLIHWESMAKNMRLKVGQMLQYFSHNNKVPTIGVTRENSELPLPPNSLYSHQTQNSKMKS